MTESEAPSGLDPADIDFEQAYRSGTLVEGAVMDRLPWEIDRPQPLLVEFERSGRVTGDVLDIGCGPGDTAIYLAGLGYQVTGLDFAPTAIEKARARAAERAVAVAFAVAGAPLADRLSIAVGDSVTVTPAFGGSQQLRVAGFVDEPLGTFLYTT
ncbi:class I SAM-dependent methyltransferase, partial [Nocardia brasiliensis]|uniref:class I SAM-dependent methyltransferase n=1 Tax=Nocardia brasiliensis TaxID=37326 RepID=UPI0024554E88